MMDHLNRDRSALARALVPPLEVYWARDVRTLLRTEHWYELETVDLSAVNTHGVYIIWMDSLGRPATVYVGSGNVAERIRKHSKDYQITVYGRQSTLFVSWGLGFGRT